MQVMICSQSSTQRRFCFAPYSDPFLTLRSSMASKKDPYVTIEGSALVEKYLDGNGWPKLQKKAVYVPKRHVPRGGCLYQYQPEHNPLYQMKPVSSHQVVQFGDGTSNMEYTKMKHAAVSY